MTRMPFGRTLFRYSSVTRWIARVGVLQLFLVGQRGLVAERHLAAEPHLAVAVDLDHLDQHVVASVRTSWTARIRESAIWEMWSNPSVLGMTSTKAPNSTIFFTFPR